MIDFLVYLGSGKLLLFFLKKFPPIQTLSGKSELLSELYDCDLCFGFWVNLFLAPFFRINIDEIENRILGWLMFACLSTLMSHLMSTGYSEIFGNVVIIDAQNKR